MSGQQPERGMTKEWYGLIRELRSAGCTFAPTGSGHVRVMRDGEVVAILPGTSSDHRAIKNARALLRRKGVLSGDTD